MHAARIHLRIAQRDLQAKISGEKCGSVAARSAADYGDVQLTCFRSSLRLVDKLAHEILVRHPEARRVHQRVEGSPAHQNRRSKLQAADFTVGFFARLPLSLNRKQERLLERLR